MRARIYSAALVLSILSFCGGPAQGEELAAVEKQIIKKSQKHRSMRAKVTITETTETQGNKATTNGEGSLELTRKGDAILYRSEVKSTMVIEAGGRTMKFDSNVLEIFDGNYTYRLAEQVGLKTATKSKRDPRSVADLRAFLKHLRTEGSLKLLEEDSVGGRDAYVIEVTPASRRPGQTVVYYFGKDDGVLLKQVVRGREGQPGRTTVYSDFEFDVKIDPKRFEFQPPKGVIVQDRTGD